ncbi:hypothetical protein BJV74DRAFT_336386 [Russula compacta]|nr:hypothetical protein BJV74DRAFT_336386 [Russula compacta]
MSRHSPPMQGVVSLLRSTLFRFALLVIVKAQKEALVGAGTATSRNRAAFGSSFECNCERRAYVLDAFSIQAPGRASCRGMSVAGHPDFAVNTIAAKTTASMCVVTVQLSGQARRNRMGMHASQYTLVAMNVQYYHADPHNAFPKFMTTRMSMVRTLVYVYLSI